MHKNAFLLEKMEMTTA